MPSISRKPNGWIRLWIVLSVAWLVSLAYPGYQYIGKLVWPKSYVITNPEGQELTVVFSSEVSVEDAHKTIKSEFFPKFKEQPDFYVGRTIEEPYDNYLKINIWRRIFLSSVVLLAPPVIIFAFGCGISWVRRGFA